MLFQSWATLYAKASTGKVKVWKISVLKDTKDPKAKAVITTRYGYVDSEKLQSTSVDVEQGKNLGRANQTTPFAQACAEAESKWKKKQDKKYTQDKSGKSDLLLPMLALDFKKRGHAIKWPAYTQPKLNGVRCLATKLNETTVRYSSRGGKEFTTLAHLTPLILKSLSVGQTLDGELFSEHLTFQEIISLVKRYQDATEMIEYWVYDIVLPRVPFSKRLEIYLKQLPIVPSQALKRAAGSSNLSKLPLFKVPTIKVENQADFLRQHEIYTGFGFEGTIIRNAKGVYRKDFRSPDLQKYKDFIDEEFEIIGGKEGVGLAKGTITWRCVTEEGKEFDARPRGTLEQRKYWFEHLEEFIGKKLTVRYQNRSDDNIPIFPIGISIREGTIGKDGNFKPDF